MEPVVKHESRSFPVIKPIIPGFYRSEYLGIEIKVLDPREYDPDNANQYTEDDIMINGSDACYKAIIYEHPDWSDAAWKTAAKDVLQRWFRLEKTENLFKSLKSIQKDRQLPHLPIKIEEDEEKVVNSVTSANVQPPKKLENTIKKVIMTDSRIIYGTYINEMFISDLLMYVSPKFYFKVHNHLKYINSKALQLKQEGKAEELAEFRRIVGLKDLEITNLKAKNNSAETSITSLTKQVDELTVDREIMQQCVTGVGIELDAMTRHRNIIQARVTAVSKDLAVVTSQRDIVRAEVAAAIEQRNDLQRQNIQVLEELNQNKTKLRRVCRQHIPANQVEPENIQTVYLVKNAADDTYQYKIFALRRKSNAGYDNYMSLKPTRTLVKEWIVPEAKHIVCVLRELYLRDYMMSSDLDLPARKDEAWLVALITGIVKSRLIA